MQPKVLDRGESPQSARRIANFVRDFACGLTGSLSSFGISPAGSDARNAAQLAQKIRSLYTGNLSQRNIPRGVARLAGDREGGEDEWVGPVLQVLRSSLCLFFW